MQLIMSNLMVSMDTYEMVESAKTELTTFCEGFC